MLTVMWGFSVSFYVTDNNEKFPNFMYACWHAFNLIFGMTNIQIQNWVAVLSGTLYMVIIVILFFNILIAIISDGFERVMERSKLSSRFEKASIITEIEGTMSSEELADPKL